MPGAILVIDDDDDLRQVTLEILAAYGHDAVGCANGREALDYLGDLAEPPAAILLDLEMPVMDGYEFRAAQLHDGAIAAVPVIVISSERHIDPVLHAAAYLTKPFTIDQLLDRLERLSLSATRS